MNEKIYRENITEIDLLNGEYVEGKGTQIWENISSFAVYNDFTPLNKEVLILTLKNTDNIFIYRIRYIENGVEKEFECEEYADIRRSENYFPIDKVIEMVERNEVINLYIAEKPKFLGYIDFSKYDTSLAGQTDFLQDLWGLRDYVFETDEYNIVDIKEDRELEIVHGYHLIPKGLEQHFDGTSYEFNVIELDDFWDSFNGDIFDSIDIDDEVTVYHYKGKDWYVVPSAEEEEYEVHFINEDGEIDSEMVTGYLYSQDTQTKKVIDYILKELEGIKEDLLLHSKLDFDLGLGVEDEDCDCVGKIANLNIIDAEFESRWVFKALMTSFMLEIRDYELAYQKLIEQYLDDRNYLFGKYKHLPMTEKLLEKEDMKIVRTSKDNVSKYTVANKDKAFHFKLGEIFHTTPKKFVERVKEYFAENK